MTETTTAPAPTPAGNIAAAIADKAAGKAPSQVVDSKVPTAIPAGEKVVPQVGPNAGKEVYVVDGKEIYLTPEQARMYVQKGISFEPKISQLGRLQQETAAFLDTLANDPGKVIFNEKFGKPEEVLGKILNSAKVSDGIKQTIGKWYYDNIILREQMSPEQRELADSKAKTAELEAWKAQQEEQRIQQENDRNVQHALGVLKAQVNEAMKEAGVPLDSKIAPQLARRVAQIMQLGMATGKSITPKEAMEKVKSEILEYQKAYYDVLDEDKLVEQIGKENAEKIRKFYLKKVKEKEKESPKGSALPSKRDERKTMTPDQFRDYLADLKKK
jgi:hypothetical protein